MILSLFNLIDIDSKFIEDHIDHYNNWIQKEKLEDTPENFFSYSISKMKNFDLDCNVLIIGRKRSSKSTLACDLVELIYKARNEKFNYREYVDNFVIYDNTQDTTGVYGGVYLDDELHLTADRRRSMTKGNVSKSVDINFFASLNAIHLGCIQNFSDLDQRIVDSASVLIIVDHRGEGMLFISSNVVAILKNTFGFEIFNERPELLKNTNVAPRSLRSLPSYICDIKWKDKRGEPFFEYYKKNKEAWQEKRKQEKQEMIVLEEDKKKVKIRNWYKINTETIAKAEIDYPKVKIYPGMTNFDKKIAQSMLTGSTIEMAAKVAETTLTFAENSWNKYQKRNGLK
jgi:hypothetical protein